MAPINEIPFLKIVLDELYSKGIQHFILATGYKSDVIQTYFASIKTPYSIKYSIEKEQLGTGGAIAQALELASSEKVLIVNGDTFFKLNLTEFIDQAEEMNQPCVIALKKVFNSDRYGSVQLIDNQITEFEEKAFKTAALISSGIYLLNRIQFLEHSFPEKFSFEKDYLEIYAKKQQLFGIEMEGYFIDIGIPEDYEKAQHDFKTITNR
jgi:D-glycero-alpha-D-manno-heptose 1-phosphate guanylyltransferase